MGRGGAGALLLPPPPDGPGETTSTYLKTLGSGVSATGPRGIVISVRTSARAPAWTRTDTPSALPSRGFWGSMGILTSQGAAMAARAGGIVSDPWQTNEETVTAPFS